MLPFMLRYYVRVSNMKIFSKDFYRQKKEELLADETKWKLFQNACIFAVMGFTSLVMSIVNIFTHQGSFTWVTLAFSIACAINLLLIRQKGKAAVLSIILFSIEMILIFIYFIVSGIPDGFSVLWTAMLPCFGLLMLGVKHGTLASLVMFAIIAFFYWIPYGQSLLQYPYSPTFKIRFPLLYLAFLAVAVMLEKIREASKSALTESRRKYEFLCYHDALTGLYNRFWLQSVIDNPEQYHLKPAAVAVLDIDIFKFINDNFGHPSGDIVIKDIGQAIVDTLNGSGDVCRWGGDEFLIIFHTDIDAEMVCKRIVDNVCAHRFVFDKENFNTTVSVGLVLAPNGGTDDIGKLIHQADINLYHAKDYGKNCTINSELKP